MRRWRWRLEPALQRRKAAQEAAVWRSAGRSEAGRALAKVLPVGSGGWCSLATPVDRSAQFTAVFAPVGHGQLTGVVSACGDERAAAGYSAVAGDRDPPGGAAGARVCPVDAGHAVLPSCRKLCGNRVS